jgi:hypothetical protein
VIALRVTDDDRGFATKALLVTVHNVDPAIESLELDAAVIRENDEVLLTGGFSDPGSLDLHSLRVDWGDGESTDLDLDPGARGFSVPHRYLDDDPSGTPWDEYLIHVELSDDDGGFVEQSTAVRVENVAPELLDLALDTTVIDENQSANLSGSFTDAGTLDTHTVRVQWGDGTTSDAAVDPALRTFQATHVYADDDPTGTPSDDYTILVTVTDDDTGSDASSTQASIVFDSAFRLGDRGADAPGAVIADSDGNLYVTGRFTGTVDFDPGPGVFELSAGALDTSTAAMVAKYLPGGSLDWALPLAVDRTGAALAVDPWNNLYVATEDAVTKIDRRGIVQWEKSIGTSTGGTIAARGMAVDASGNVFVAGRFTGTYTLAADSFPSAGLSDVFVARLDWFGDPLWARAVGGTGDDVAEDLVRDVSGGLFVAGSFHDTVDFDPGLGVTLLATAGTGINPSDSDGFVLALTESGDFNWARQLGGVDNDRIGAMAIDGSGNLYVAGEYRGPAVFGSFSLNSFSVLTPGDDLFVARLDGGGTFDWARGIGGEGESGRAGDVTVDGYGDVYVTGQLRRTADFDPGPGSLPMTARGFSDAFAAILDPGGALVWAGLSGGADDLAAMPDEGLGITTDGYGRFYVAGTFAGTADFDPGPGAAPLTSEGDLDLFVSKFAHVSTPSVKVIDSPPVIESCQLDSTTLGQGEILTLSGEFSDFGTADTHRVLIDWGDGRTSSATVDEILDTFAATHQYQAPAGDYAILIAAIDDDSRREVVETMVAVTGAAPPGPASVMAADAVFRMEVERAGDSDEEDGGVLSIVEVDRVIAEMMDESMPAVDAGTARSATEQMEADRAGLPGTSEPLVSETSAITDRQWEELLSEIALDISDASRPRGTAAQPEEGGHAP